jgi:hypothetical protein
MADLIRFADGVMVEVAPNPNRTTPIAGKSAERVAEAFQSAVEIIAAVVKSVVGSTGRAVREAGAADAEIEFGIGFSIEGSVYIAKLGHEGSLKVKVKVGAGQP